MGSEMCIRDSFEPDLEIPVSSGLAASIKDRQLAEQQEQEEVKRLVLDYNQRQEEEIYNGIII